MRTRPAKEIRYRRAAIYLRVSSDEQVRHGYSLADQEERCRELARSLGAEEVRVYCDGGESGSKLERPGLSGLREAVQAGMHDLVVVLDPDRLARNLYLQLVLHDEFRQLGVALEFVNLDWEDTPDGRLFLQMRGAIAEYEREKIRMRTYAGRRRKAKQGGLPCGPVDAYGYRYNREAQRLEVDPIRAATVREIFRWAACGDPLLFADGPPGPGRIARELIRLGVPTARGGRWHGNTVRQIIRNRRYVGELVTFRTTLQRGRRRPSPEGTWITVPVPPLVDLALFEQANATLALNGRRYQGRPHHPYLLSGLIRCGLCGHLLHGSTQWLRRRTRPVAVPYYACGNRGCRLPLQRAEPLEERVWAAVAKYLGGLDLTVAESGMARREYLLRLHQDQQEQRRRLATAFRLGGLAEAEYQAELTTLQQAIAETEHSLSETESGVEQGPQAVEHLEPAARKGVLRLVVERVTLDPPQLVVWLRRTGSARGTYLHSPLR